GFRSTAEGAWPIVNSMKLALLSGVIGTTLALLTAYVIERRRPPGARAIEALSLLPAALPGTVIGVGYILAFNVPPLLLTATAWPSSSRENDVVRKETFMRRLLLLLLAGVLALPLAAPPADTAEDRLVVYTAYEENELKTFWEQFKKDLPDLAAKASYIRGSTGPTIARLEAEKANPQADVVWGVFNDYMTGAASKGL